MESHWIQPSTKILTDINRFNIKDKKSLKVSLTFIY